MAQLKNNTTIGGNIFTVGSSAYFTSNGSIGIGTSLPVVKLTIQSADGNAIRLLSNITPASYYTNFTQTDANFTLNSISSDLVLRSGFRNTYTAGGSGWAVAHAFNVSANQTYSDASSSVYTRFIYGSTTWAPTTNPGSFALLDLYGTINQTGTASGNYNGIRLSVTETSATGTNNKLIDTLVNGVSKFFVNSTGDGYFSGNVGIGTISQTHKLDVNGNLNLRGGVVYNTSGNTITLWPFRDNSRLIFDVNNQSLFFDTTGGSPVFKIGAVDTVSSLALYSGNAERVRIDSSGRVGIGTASPAYKLDLFNGDMRLSNANKVLWSNYNGTAEGPFVLGSNDSLTVSAGDNGPGRGVINLIGHNNSSFRTDNGYIELKTTGNNTSAYLAFITGSGTERARIDNLGNVGIGTTTPSATLHVVGNVNITQKNSSFTFTGANATTSSSIAMTMYPEGTLSFDGSAGQLFSISNSMSGSLFTVNDISGMPSIEVIDTGLVKLAQYTGNVGIGTASALNKLAVYNGNIQIGSTGYGIVFPDGTVQTTSADATPPGGTTGAIQYRTASGTFGGDVSKFYIDPTTGRVGIGTTTGNAQFISVGTARLGTNSTSDYGGDLQFSGNYVRIWKGDNGPAGELRFGFTSDDTKIMGQSSVGLMLYTNTIERMRIDVTGNVGIGTSTPSSRLHVTGSQAVITAQSTNTGGIPARIDLITNWSGVNYPAYISNDWSGSGLILRASRDLSNSQGGFVFQSSAGSDVMVIRTNSGYVGIGSTAPAYKLDVEGDIYAHNSSSAGKIYFPSNAVVPYVGTQANQVYFEYGSYNLFFTRSGGTNAVTFTNTGSVGIGTTTASSRLSIYGSTDATQQISIDGTGNYSSIKLKYNGTETGFIQTFQNGELNIGTASSAFVNFYTNNTERMRITSTGLVGIGTISPANTLHVYGPAVFTSTATNAGLGTIYLGVAGNNNIPIFEINAASGTNAFRIFNSGNWRLGPTGSYGVGLITNNIQRLYIDSDGNVGIGTSSPSAKLHVMDTAGTASTVLARFEGASGRFVRIIDNDGGGGAGIQTTRVYGDSAASGTLRLLNTYGNSNRSEITVDTNYVAFSTSSATVSTERMRIDTNGNVGINTTTPTSTLDVRGVITAGNQTSTSGSTLLQGYYSSGALAVVGTEYSSGAPFIGYGVSANTAASSSFVSTTAINVQRYALTVGGGSGNGGFNFYTGAGQTPAVGSPVAMNQVMVITNAGTVGIGSVIPAYTLDVVGTARFTGALTLDTDLTVPNGGTGAGTFTTNGILYGNGTSAIQATAQGAANTVLTGTGGAPAFSGTPTLTSATFNGASGAKVSFTGATSNWIAWNTAGTTGPTFTATSVGTRLLLYPNVSASSADYAIGIDGNTLWYGVPTTSQQHRWYGGTTQAMLLSGAGALDVTSTVTGTAFIPDGSTVPTNGLYLPATNRISLATNSTERMTIDSSGRVGVGTPTPSDFGSILNFEVYNTTGSQIRLNSTSVDSVFDVNNVAAISSIGTRSAHDLFVRTNNLERMRITSAGLVGIGTTSPADLLHVFKPNTSTGIVIEAGSTPYLEFKRPSQSFWKLQHLNNAFAIQNNWSSNGYNSVLYFEDGMGRTSTPTMYFAYAGGAYNVGIGTTNPTVKLQVEGGDVSLTRAVSTSVTRTLSIGGAQQSDGTDFARLDFVNYDANDATPIDYVAARIASQNQSGAEYGNLIFSTYYASVLSERMRISSTGQVGIGTESPTSLLHINGSSNQTQLNVVSFPNQLSYAVIFKDGASASAINIPAAANGIQHTGLYDFNISNLASGYNLLFSTQGSERVRISAAGDVGIGTYSPAYKLDVWGTGRFTGALTLDTDLTVPNGGTGVSTFTTNGVLYGNGASALQATAQGGTNTVLVANNGAPSFSSTPIVGSLTATSGLTVSGGGASITGASTITGNLTVAGNLILQGNVLVSSSNVLVIDDPIIYVGEDNTTDLWDLGIVGSYTNGTYRHTGFLRNKDDGVWTVFDNLITEPQLTINWLQPGLNFGSFKSGNVNVAAATSSTSTTTGALLVAGGAGIAGNLNVGGTINSFSGSVGIGISTPLVPLDVVASSSTALHLRLRGRSSDNVGQAEFWNNAGSIRYGIIGADSTAFSFGAVGALPLTFSTALTERMRIDSAGDVGIGTNNPQNKLHVWSNGVSELVRLSGDSGAAFSDIATIGFERSTYNPGQMSAAITFGRAGGAAEADIRFKTQTVASSLTERMRIDNTGKVGIGSTVPLQLLSVGSTAANSIHFGTGDSATGAWIRNDGSNLVLSTNAGDMYFGYSGASKNLRFMGGGTNTQMLLTSAGLVGIGTASPASTLQVAGTVTLGSDSVNSLNVRMQRLAAGVRAANHWYVATNNTPTYLFGQNLTWTSENAGTVDPTQASRPYYERYIPGLGKEFGFVNVTSGSFTLSNLVSNMYLTQAGLVGIGTTSPAYKLDVAGTINALSTAGSTNGIRITATGGNDSWLNFYRAGYENWYMGSVSNSSSLNIKNDSLTAVTILSTGNVGINTSSPAFKFHVVGTTNLAGAVTFVTDAWNTSADGKDRFYYATNGRSYYKSGDGSHEFRNSSDVGKVFINSSGNVSIGDSSTSSTNKLTVYSNDSNDDDNLIALGFSSFSPYASIGTHNIDGTAGGIKFSTKESNSLFERMRITSSGYVGIGTLSASYFVTINSPVTYAHKIGGPDGIYTDLSNGTGTFRTQVSSSTSFLGTINSGDLAFSTNATERMRITSGGDVMINQTSSTGTGKLGIAGRLALDVAGSNNFSGQLYFTNVGGNPFNLQSSASGGLAFWGYNGTWYERMRIDNIGNVGIGTASPDATLVIAGDGQGTAAMTTNQNLGGTLVLSDNGVGHASGSGGAIIFGGTGSAGNLGRFAAIKGLLNNSTSNSTGDLAFSTRNAVSDATLTERMRITQTGDIGVGTSVPAARLDFGISTSLALGQTILTYRNANTRYGIGVASSESRLFAPSGASLTFGHVSTADGSTYTERMRITSAGDVGIGTANPLAKLHVYGGLYNQIRVESNSTQATLAFYDGDTSSASTRNWALTSNKIAYGDFAISTSNARGGDPVGAGTTRLYINASGNVGIGTTVPSGKLTVAQPTGTFSSSAPFFSSQYENTQHFNIYMDGNWNTHLSSIQVSTNQSALAFDTNSLERMRIGNNGNVSIGTTDTLNYGRLGVAGPGTALPSNNTNLLPSSIVLYDTNGSTTGSTSGIFNKKTTGGLGSGIGFIRESASTWGTAIAFYNHPPATTNLDDLTERMRIDSGGNVSIGVSSATARLHVVGQAGVSAMHVFGAGFANLFVDYYGGGSNYYDASTHYFRGAGGASTTQVIITPAGNVGIGTGTVNYKLQVNGSFAATTKSFVIDHPTNPGMKLRYGSLESPYHGVRLTGEGEVVNGSITINLPNYIKGLCKQEGAQVQLTNFKHGKVLWVEDLDVDHNRFTVACDVDANNLKPYKFYWSFTAIRKDIEDLVVEY